MGPVACILHVGPAVLCLLSLSNILFVYSGLSAPDTFTHLSTAMPPQAFGGSGWGQGRRVMTYIVEVGTELCSETMLEKCTIG